MRAVRTMRFSKIVVLLLAAGVLLSPPSAPGARRDADRGKKAPRSNAVRESTPATKPPPHPAVVRVAAAEKGAVSYGSGTLVGCTKEHGVVVTNWHVVRDAAGEVSVEFPDGFRSKATVLETDQTWDLAALLISPPKAAPVAIAETMPIRGDRLTIAGYGSGTYREATGKVTQYVSPGKNEPFEMVEVNVPARDGDSGGPIFNGRRQLAGVLFGSADGCTNGSHGKRVRWFLLRALAKMPELAKSIAP